MNAVVRSSIGLSALLCVMNATPSAAQAPPGAVLVRHATLIDGTGAAPRADVDILIRGDRIAAIGQGLPDEQGATVVDASGKFVMPGLIDVHTHLDTPMVFQLTPAEKQAIVDHTPLAFLYNGVTTVLNLSSPPEWIFPLRDAQRAGTVLAPRIYATGRSFTPEGGWGGRHGGALTDVASVRALASLLVKHKADGFKIIIEDGLGRTATYKEMPDDLLKAISAEADRAKLPIYVHAINIEEYRRAIPLSPRAIAHGLEDPLAQKDPILDALKAAKIAVVPTISLFESFNRFDGQPRALDDPILRASVPGFLLDHLKRQAYRDTERSRFQEVARMDANEWARRKLPIFLSNTLAMHKAGITIGVGTDAGGPVGYDFQGYQTPREVELLVEAGLTPMAALVAATKNGAEIIGVGDRLGTIEKGKWADLLVLGANPLDAIANIRRIETVVQGGVVYPRARFAVK